MSGHRVVAAIAALVATVVVASCSGAKPTPAESASKLVDKGLQAQNAGNTSAALADYQAALKVNPLDQIAYYDIGVILQARGDLPAASGAYQRALLIKPRYKAALFNLAIVTGSNSPARAVEMYEQLNGFDPHDPNVLLNLGLLLRRLGQNVAAKPYLAEAIRLDPSYASRVPAPAKTSKSGAPHPTPSGTP
jgi:tetratricopeptide (TPR) repeat protein